MATKWRMRAYMVGKELAWTAVLACPKGDEVESVLALLIDFLRVELEFAFL